MTNNDTCYDDFEVWEAYYDFHERRDYKGLVDFCEGAIEHRPNDLQAAERLVDAYLRNGDYDRAIEFAAKIHRKHPDMLSFAHKILEALFALGKSENDFDWTVRPTVVRLTEVVADRCYQFLLPKRKPRYIHDLRSEYAHGDFVSFTDDELLEYLRRDSRFVVAGDDPLPAKISVARRTRRVRNQDKLK